MRPSQSQIGARYHYRNGLALAYVKVEGRDKLNNRPIKISRGASLRLEAEGPGLLTQVHPVNIQRFVLTTDFAVFRS
jgi:hypothetical protein